MRKLIVAGIITVLALIGWISYLRYDTNKFIKELSQELPPKQRDKSTVHDARDPLVDGIGKNAQMEHKNTSPSDSKEMDEDNVLPTDINADIKGKVGTLDFEQIPEQIPEGIQISPELEKLFIEHNNLWQQSIEVSKELAPIINRTFEMNERLRVIGQELSAARDEGTKRKVLSEWEAIDKWIEEIKPKVTGLEDEAKLLSNKRLRLVSEYGFSSEDDFLKTHGMVYRTWLSDQEQ